MYIIIPSSTTKKMAQDIQLKYQQENQNGFLSNPEKGRKEVIEYEKQKQR